jgi:hypothetical protein
MKTNDLIELLAQHAPAQPPGQAGRRLWAALALGGSISLGVVVLWLRCQPLLVAGSQPWFWMKAAFTGLLTAVGVALVRRLATPGAAARITPWLGVAVIVAMGSLGIGQLLSTPSALRMTVWLGQSWKVCALLILLLALPIYVALVFAVRTLAPTRLRLSGAAAGFSAGAFAATLYGLHCPEQGAAFVMTWYSLGIAASAAVGALTGPRLMRW